MKTVANRPLVTGEFGSWKSLLRAEPCRRGSSAQSGLAGRVITVTALQSIAAKLLCVTTLGFSGDTSRSYERKDQGDPNDTDAEAAP